MDVEEDLFSTESLFYTDGVEPGRAHGNCVEKLLASRRKQVPSDPYAPFVKLWRDCTREYPQERGPS